MIKSPMYSPPPRPRHRRKPRVRPHPGLRHLGQRHRRRYGCIIMRITGIAQPHRAFRQSADAKLTVPIREMLPYYEEHVKMFAPLGFVPGITPAQVEAAARPGGWD